tara:strand:- start:1639 stop:2097 length:459 start_codon:yes stop_codon:yes gene_type:complete
MSRFFLSISFLFFLINISNAARENTGYDRGLINKNIKVINELLDKKKYKQSIELLKKEIKKDKLNPDLYNYLGYAYRKNGNLEPAILSYKEALRLDPKHTEAHNYIGIAYLKVGNIDQAKFHLGKLKELCEAQCKEYKSLKKLLNETLNYDY